MLRIYNQKCVLIQSISGRTAASGYIICIMAVYILGLLEARKNEGDEREGNGGISPHGSGISISKSPS